MYDSLVTKKKNSLNQKNRRYMTILLYHDAVSSEVDNATISE